MTSLIFSVIIALLTLPLTVGSWAKRQLTDSALDQRQVIRAPEVETLEASLQGDFTALERLWADDFEFTAPNGLTIPKAAYIDMLKSGAVKYERLELESESLQVRVFGESATASGRFRVKGQANGHVLDGIDQSLTVYVRRDGTWRQVATLLTRVTTFGRS